MTTTTKIHVFEAAGLGKAPFTWMGCSEQRGPIKRTINGLEVEVGAPGQPMGSCSFCGQGIAEVHSIKSADGKVFTVGSDCVAKTADKGLRSIIAGIRTQKARERNEKRIAKAFATLDSSPAIQEALSAKKGPYKGTLLEWATWMRHHAGVKGGLDVARTIEKAQADLEALASRPELHIHAPVEV